MAELMTNLAEVVVEIKRLEPQNDDPMRHAKRQILRAAVSILNHAAVDAWSAVCAVTAMDDAAKEPTP